MEVERGLGSGDEVEEKKKVWNGFLPACLI